MTPAVVGLVAALAVCAVVGSVRGALQAVRADRVVRRLAPSPTPGPARLPDLVAAVVAVRAKASGAGGRARRADRALPVLLDQVTRQLRSGASLPLAVQVAAVSTPEVAGTLADDLDRGVPLGVAVDDWRSGAPTPARSLVAAALSLGVEAGGSVGAVLDGVTDTLRDRVALDREVAALASQSRASAAVLVVAPMAFTALAASADRRVAEALLGRPLGWACLAGGALLDGLGALWMARLVGRAR